MNSGNSQILPPAPLALIGLGNMGLPLGRRLMEAGYRIVGYDAQPAARDGDGEWMRREAQRGACISPSFSAARAPRSWTWTTSASRNIRVCLQRHQPFQAAVRAVYETLKALREGAGPAQLDRLASGDLIRKVTRSDDYERWTREFLGPR